MTDEDNDKQSVLFGWHQAIAEESGNKFYGDGGTIHETNTLDVEIDGEGRVCSVWFRCRTLPFRIFRRESGEPCHDNPHLEIHGIEIKITP